MKDSQPKAPQPASRRWHQPLVIVLGASAVAVVALIWPPAAVPIGLAIAVAELLHRLLRRPEKAASAGHVKQEEVAKVKG